MIKELQKYFGNVKKDRTYCEQILGTNTQVLDFAKFWDSNGQDLMLLAAFYIHTYTTDEEFTKEELNAFKKGIASIGMFFNQCSIEVEQRLQKELLMQKEDSNI